MIRCHTIRRLIQIKSSTSLYHRTLSGDWMSVIVTGMLLKTRGTVPSKPLQPIPRFPGSKKSQKRRYERTGPMRFTDAQTVCRSTRSSQPGTGVSLFRVYCCDRVFFYVILYNGVAPASSGGGGEYLRKVFEKSWSVCFGKNVFVPRGQGVFVLFLFFSLATCTIMKRSLNNYIATHISTNVMFINASHIYQLRTFCYVTDDGYASVFNI